MPVFEYKGFDASGKSVKGVRDADSAKSLRTVLKRDGILATDVKESGKDNSNKKAGVLGKQVNLTFLQRVGAQDIAVTTRLLATLLQAGVPMVDSLNALIDQSENAALRRMLSQIKTDVNEGTSLADAMVKHKSFDHIYVNMVRAGESSGTLDVVLERLAEFKEGQARIQGEIMGALLYPLIMVFVGLANITIMFTVVVPRITRIFEHAKVQLPLMTRILIFVSSTARNYWWLILIGMVASVLLFRRWKSTEKGTATWDSFVLKLPIFGSLALEIAVARFARTLGTLLSSGVSLLVSLDIVKNVVANAKLAAAVETTKDAIREGEEIAPPLKRTQVFPAMLIHMIAIGEKSGQLENMLTRAATAFESRADAKLKGLMSLLSPLLILGMGLAVGFIVFSILTPILQMNTLIK